MMAIVSDGKFETPNLARMCFCLDVIFVRISGDSLESVSSPTLLHLPEGKVLKIDSMYCTYIITRFIRLT